MISLQINSLTFQQISLCSKVTETSHVENPVLL